jgi:hypothetical protein
MGLEDLEGTLKLNTTSIIYVLDCCLSVKFRRARMCSGFTGRLVELHSDP